MLSWDFIVQRLKEELSLPFQTLEKSDEQIVDYLKRNALKEFEFYFPQKWRLTLITTDPAFQVPGRHSEYFLIDPDDREIKTIRGFYVSLGTHLFDGHPPYGPWSTGEVAEWHLDVFNSNLLAPFSNFKYITEFMPPNMLRVTPKYRGRATVEYERSHDPELSSIDPELERTFINLCQGMFFMLIGRIRQKYSTTSTPFGEIPLNGDLIYNEGKEIYDKTIEEMNRGTLTNIVFHHG